MIAGNHSTSSRCAFTLVEVLIVVVLISILAGVAAMQVGSSSDDAALATLYTNEQLLQQALDRYKVDHGGRAPTQIVADSLPQLTQSTNVQGVRGSGAAYVFGPYLVNEVPVNTVTSTRRIKTTTESPPSDFTDASAGWLYNSATGQIWGVQGIASGSKERLNAKLRK